MTLTYQDTFTFDSTGYNIHVDDVIKVTCWSGPDYYKVLPFKAGSFWLLQLNVDDDQIIHEGVNIRPLYWLIYSYMGKNVIQKMTLEEAIKILKYHQAWRRGDEGAEMQAPELLTVATDVIIKAVESNNLFNKL